MPKRVLVPALMARLSGEDGPLATVEDGGTRLARARAPGHKIIGFEVYRAKDDGTGIAIEAVKRTKCIELTVRGGLCYHYSLCAFNANGRASPPSNGVAVEMSMAGFATSNTEQAGHV